MEEAADHRDAAFAQHREPVVAPGEVEPVRPLGSDGFPQDREAHGGDAEPGDEIEILAPVAMAGFGCLVSIRVVEADEGAFGASP